MEQRIPEPPVHGHLEAVGLDLGALTHGELGRGVTQLVPRRGNLDALGGEHVGVVVEDGRRAKEGQGHEGRRRLAQVVEVRVLSLSGQVVFEVCAVRALGIGLEVFEEAGSGELRNSLTDDVEGGGGGLGRCGRADLGEGLEVVALVRSLDPVFGLRLVEPLDVGLGHLAVRAPEGIPDLGHDGALSRGRPGRAEEPGNQEQGQRSSHPVSPLIVWMTLRNDQLKGAGGAAGL